MQSTKFEEQSKNFDTENTLDMNQATKNNAPTFNEANIPVLKRGIVIIIDYDKIFTRQAH
jgi:hypothetical protein